MQCRSERDYVNAIVDAGSSSVRIQRITGGEMLRAGIRIKPTSATNLPSRVRPQKFFTHYRRRNAMRLANREPFCALAIFVLSHVPDAHKPPDEHDTRNQPPSPRTARLHLIPPPPLPLYAS